jgi:hypothetical protein
VYAFTGVQLVKAAPPAGDSINTAQLAHKFIALSDIYNVGNLFDMKRIGLSSKCYRKTITELIVEAHRLCDLTCDERVANQLAKAIKNAYESGHSAGGGRSHGGTATDGNDVFQLKSCKYMKV